MMGNNMRGGVGMNRGRGGMNAGGMMPMGGMGMNPMMAGMSGMGMGIQGKIASPLGCLEIPRTFADESRTGGFQSNNAHFNPAFFNNQAAGGDWSNPHGAKRHRQE